MDLFKDGSHQMKPLKMQAGQKITIVVELDFNRYYITPDWSLTAWAAKGEVHVMH